MTGGSVKYSVTFSGSQRNECLTKWISKSTGVKDLMAADLFGLFLRVFPFSITQLCALHKGLHTASTCTFCTPSFTFMQKDQHTLSLSFRLPLKLNGIGLLECWWYATVQRSIYHSPWQLWAGVEKCLLLPKEELHELTCGAGLSVMSVLSDLGNTSPWKLAYWPGHLWSIWNHMYENETEF